MLKRITSILLLSSIILLSAGTAVSSQDETLYDNELAFLQAIHLIPDEFSVAEKITKTEFLNIVMKMLYNDMDFSLVDGPETLFQDVDNTHPYYDVIKASKDLGIIQGDASAFFYPDSEIKADIAVTILINALNYKLYAEKDGGYPTGYFSVAKDIGLLQSVAINEDTITKNIAVKLIYNALFVDYVVVTEMTEIGFDLKIDRESNILWEKMKIKEYDAQIIDNGFSSLYGDSINDETRIILQNVKNDENIIAYSNGTDIANYLGYRLKIFVKTNEETSRNEVVYYSSNKSVKKESLKGANIVDVTNGYIEYERDAEANKFDKYKIEQSPTVILNGVCFYQYDSISDIMPKDGIVDIVDNNSDGTYELIHILSFNVYTDNLKGTARNIVVDRINLQAQIIYCKLNSLANLELDDTKTSYRIISSDDIYSLEDIMPYDVISIAQAPALTNQKTHYILYVTRQSISGNITQISAQNNEVYVNNTPYMLSDSLTSIKQNYIEKLPFDTNISFYFDALDNIAYTSNFSIQTKNYAYLIGIEYGDSFGGELRIKLFTKEGEIKVLPVSSNAKVDAVSYNNLKDIENAIRQRPSGSTASNISRPIIYKENSNGEITNIETDTPNYPLNTGEYTPYTVQTHIKYSMDEIVDTNALKAAYRAPMTTEYKAKSSSFDGKFVITSDTLIMNVPDIDTYGLDRAIEYSPDQVATAALTLSPKLAKLYENPLEDKYYKIMPVTSLDYIYFYDAQAYDIDPDTGVAGLVVLRGKTNAIYYGNVPYDSSFKMSVFLRTTEVYDEESDCILTKIYWTEDGTEIFSTVTDKNELLFSYKYLLDGCNPNHTDNTVNGVPPCEIYQAFKGSSNYSKAVIEPLEAGDIVRIMTKKGRLSHLERVVDISRIDTTMCTNMYPTNQRYLYSSNLTGINSYQETYGMPNDVRAYWAGHNNSYSITLAKPNAISGSTVKSFIGQKKFEDIDLSKPNTFTEAYLKISDIPIVHVKFLKDGSVKVALSDLSCIKTYQDTKDLNTVTNLVMKYMDFRVEQLFVIDKEV